MLFTKMVLALNYAFLANYDLHAEGRPEKKVTSGARLKDGGATLILGPGGPKFVDRPVKAESLDLQEAFNKKLLHAKWLLFIPGHPMVTQTPAWKTSSEVLRS